ncbi:hypothetical protein TREES_T100003430 [Tupaia chinensis]|uniref:Uncharacterized protein n=1 Tax=Tupaia chinensis TaxID=246437 RepID=L9JBP9_TUPCH|nr:hypothetical protein TREES_T100003430 [Tupaia chinensis]
MTTNTEHLLARQLPSQGQPPSSHYRSATTMGGPPAASSAVATSLPACAIAAHHFTLSTSIMASPLTVMALVLKEKAYGLAAVTSTERDGYGSAQSVFSQRDSEEDQIHCLMPQGYTPSSLLGQLGLHMWISKLKANSKSAALQLHPKAREGSVIARSCVLQMGGYGKFGMQQKQNYDRDLVPGRTVAVSSPEAVMECLPHCLIFPIVTAPYLLLPVTLVTAF